MFRTLGASPLYFAFVLFALLQACEFGESTGSDPTDTDDLDTGGEEARTRGERSWEEVPCEGFELAEAFRERAHCGYVEVPALHEEADSSGTFRIAVIEIDPENPSESYVSPVIYLEGGPGSAITGGLSNESFAGRLIGSLAVNQPVVFFDQRGIGKSEPELPRCIDATEPVPGVNGVEDCGAFFARDGLDLRAFNSVELALDLDLIREALGFPDMVLYGSSYGSRLAQFAFSEYENDKVAAYVLDGAVRIEVPQRGSEAIKFHALLRDAFDACTSDASCDANYPDLEERFYAMLAGLPEPGLGSRTFTVEISPNGSPVFLDHIVGPDEMFDLITTGFILDDFIRAFPAAVVAYEQFAFFGAAPADVLRDLRILEYALTQGGSSSLRADASFLMLCNDRSVGYTSLSPEVDPRLATYLRDTYEPVAELVDELCDIWLEEPSVALSRRAAASTDVPTLILAGRFDSQTPASETRQIAARLDNVFSYEFVSGHGIVGNECADGILSSFLADPSSDPSQDCINEQTIPFVANFEDAKLFESPSSSSVDGETLLNTTLLKRLGMKPSR